MEDRGSGRQDKEKTVGPWRMEQIRTRAYVDQNKGGCYVTHGKLAIPACLRARKRPEVFAGAAAVARPLVSIVHHHLPRRHAPDHDNS